MLEHTVEIGIYTTDEQAIAGFNCFCHYCMDAIREHNEQVDLEVETYGWETYLMEEAERVRVRADLWEWFTTNPEDDGWDD